MGFSRLWLQKTPVKGRDLIPLYRLRRRTDGKCLGCGRKLSVRPLSINFEDLEVERVDLKKIS
jgi:hypothetical protein